MSPQLIAIVVLLVLSAVFSATETAYTSLSLIQQKMLESKKSRAARTAYRLCQKPDILITTVLVGNNVVNISVSALVTAYAISTFGSWAVGYATGILTLVILIFGEITPKQIAMDHNMAIATSMAYPIKTLTVVLFPVIWLLQRISHAVACIFSHHAEPKLTAEGMMHMVDAAEEGGVVDEYESDLMQRALHFSEIQVRTVMTHRTDVFCLDERLSIEKAFPRIVSSGFSRIPVFRDTTENIVGIVLVRDVLKAQTENRQKEALGSIARQPAFVPEQMHLDEVFLRFKRDRPQMAIVLDEYGGFSGVVTMEDVAEQLFGELFDEHEYRFPDRIVENETVPGTYLVMADTPFMQLVDELSLSLEEEGKTGTVAAYLLDLTGDIPSEGDVIQSQIGTFRVISMKGNRMEKVEFSPAVDDGTLQ